MGSLLRWRARPAADSAQPARQPRDWNTKEVVRFLEQQGLNAYAPAAKKAKLKGTHLLNASTTPFFKSPRVCSAPCSPTSSSYSSSSSSSSIEHSQLRASASSLNFGLLRSRSFVFGPRAAPRRTSHSAVNGESEALARLCDQLGVLSVVDKRRLWLALLNFKRQQEELQSKAAVGKPHSYKAGGGGRSQEPVVGLPCAIKLFSESCISLSQFELATRLRAQSAVDFVGDSSAESSAEHEDFFAEGPAPPSGAQSPSANRRKDHDQPNAGIAEELLVAALSQASPKRRSSIEEEATRPPAALLATSRAVKTIANKARQLPAPTSTGEQFQTTPTLAYADQQGVVVIKCCLQLSALIDTSDHHHDSLSSPSGSELPEVDERSRKRLRAAELMKEVHLLHGLLLQALLMEEGARGLGVRVSYRDAEGDLVGIQSDNALRYAYEDWRKVACRQPRKHPFMRVVVAVATSPHCNK